MKHLLLHQSWKTSEICKRSNVTNPVWHQRTEVWNVSSEEQMSVNNCIVLKGLRAASLRPVQCLLWMCFPAETPTAFYIFFILYIFKSYYGKRFLSCSNYCLEAFVWNTLNFLKKALGEIAPLYFKTNYFCRNSADTLPRVAISPWQNPHPPHLVFSVAITKVMEHLRWKTVKNSVSPLWILLFQLLCFLLQITILCIATTS